MVDDILRDALSRVEPAKHPGGYYSADGDCVFLYIEDSPYLRDRIDSLLTVYRNLEDRSRVIGLQVKGIKRLTKKGIIGVQVEAAERKGAMQIDAVHLLLQSYRSEAPGDDEERRTGAYADAFKALGCRPVSVDLQPS